MVELKEVSKSYAAPSGQEALKVLSGINLKIESGESLSVMGPSGSGKSTLLNLMGSMDQPTSGQILFEGQDLGQMNETSQSQFRAKEVGFIFQNHRLLPQCTVMENILLPTLSLHAQAPAEAVEIGQKLLAKVGLSERVDHYPSELSGGECQRVAVVRSLINSPKLILADEPTGALDHDNAHGLMKLLCELSESENCAVVIVTHDSAMLEYTNRSVKLSNGQLV